MVKVCVLGASGMLGNAVANLFFDSGYEMWSSYRNADVASKIPGDRFRFDPTKTKWESMIPNADYVINCIGVIKPFMSANMTDSIFLNAIFPRMLSKICNDKGSKLIHITTDCVFSGKDGAYTESSLHDALDEYGKSKSLGENDDCMVLRTSIIGDEIHKGASLVAWIKSMDGKPAKGFTNHLWNGVTTDQYADICKQIIENDLYEKGVFHVFSDIVDKFQLVSMIAARYGLNIDLQEFEAPIAVDRTMSTEKDLNGKLTIPSLKDQIANMRVL